MGVGLSLIMDQNSISENPSTDLVEDIHWYSAEACVPGSVLQRVDLDFTRAVPAT